MLNEIHPKYIMSVYPKAGRPYNPIHDEINGSTATIINLEIGERGWVAYETFKNEWHRLHLSIVEDVLIADNGDLTVTTTNTVYKFAKLAEE